jgi:hypothetical protein
MLDYLVHAAPRAASLQPLFHAVSRLDGLAPGEMASYIGRFLSDRQWNEAFLAWLNELPAARRQQIDSPVNGDFESTDSTGAPFEWQFAPGEGLEAGIVRRSDDNGHALHLAFAGTRNSSAVASQLLLLQQGLAYTLRWQSRLDALDTPRGLIWVIRCAQPEGETLLSTEPLRGTATWRKQSADFVVPADCPAQWLQLQLAARVPAESFALGAAWFDDVGILLK